MAYTVYLYSQVSVSMYVLNVRLIRDRSLVAEVGHPPSASSARSVSLNARCWLVSLNTYT